MCENVTCLYDRYMSEKKCAQKNINLIEDAVTIRVRCSVTAIISNPHYILVLYSRRRLYKIEHSNFFTESPTRIRINRRPVSWGYCRTSAYDNIIVVFVPK